MEHAYSKDGGLAVLKGNIAQDGCVVKTAGVDESIWKFSGPAKVFDSQDAACEGILGGKVVSGDVVVITHEGPKGGPGMQEMLDGDIIEIDIPNRSINVKLSDEELAARPMTPVTRNRYVPKSLKAYAAMESSADKGGVRIID